MAPRAAERVAGPWAAGLVADLRHVLDKPDGFPEAEAALREAIDAVPDDAEELYWLETLARGHASLGCVLKRQERRAGAAYRRAIELAPTNGCYRDALREVVSRSERSKEPSRVRSFLTSEGCR